MGIDITHRLLAYDAQNKKTITAEFDSRWKYSIAGERADLFMKKFVAAVLPTSIGIEEYASDIEKHYLSGSEFPSWAKCFSIANGIIKDGDDIETPEQARSCVPEIEGVIQKYRERASRVGIEFKMLNPSFKMVLKDAGQTEYSHFVEFSGFNANEIPSIVQAFAAAYAKCSQKGIFKVEAGEQNRYFDMQANEVSFADLSDEQREYIK